MTPNEATQWGELITTWLSIGFVAIASSISIVWILWTLIKFLWNPTSSDPPPEPPDEVSKWR